MKISARCPHHAERRIVAIDGRAWSCAPFSMPFEAAKFRGAIIDHDAPTGAPDPEFEARFNALAATFEDNNNG